jgi:hypothetical protein
MTPYSHLVVAAKLVSLAQPGDLAEYYWGAVVPDIRYLAAMRRQQTHLSAGAIVAWLDRYPHLDSFIKGYLVHCLTDYIDLTRIFYRRLPFSMLKNTLTHQHLAVLLELFYIERQPASWPLSGTHNEVLDELGLSQAISARFARSAKQYALSTSRSSLWHMAQMLGLEHDSRIEKYVSAGKRFQSSRLLKNALFLGIRAAKIDVQIAFKVSTLYRQSGAAVAAPVERRTIE